MTSDGGASRVAEALSRLGIPFLVVGSFSSNVYGVPRATLDADFVIDSDARIGEVRDALAPAFHMNPQVSFETTQMTTRYEFVHRETNFKVELFVLSADEHDQTRFARRVLIERDGLVMAFPRAEDVIIQKLRWGRAKDREDVGNILERQGDRLDWAYIEQWCDRHGTRALLETIRRGDAQA